MKDRKQTVVDVVRTHRIELVDESGDHMAVMELRRFEADDWAEHGIEPVTYLHITTPEGHVRWRCEP